jgi:hypothetical protein
LRTQQHRLHLLIGESVLRLQTLEAGFFGIDLLEASRQWEPAARLAEQIARQPGERAAEAHDRATKIRLEHFLWDGPAPTPPKVLEFDGKQAPGDKK